MNRLRNYPMTRRAMLATALLLSARIATAQTLKANVAGYVPSGNFYQQGYVPSGDYVLIVGSVTPLVFWDGTKAHYAQWSFNVESPSGGLQSVVADGLAPWSAVTKTQPDAFSVDIDVSRMATLYNYYEVNCTNRFDPNTCTFTYPTPQSSTFPFRGTFKPFLGQPYSWSNVLGGGSQSVTNYYGYVQTVKTSGNISCQSANFAGVIGSTTVATVVDGYNGGTCVSKGNTSWDLAPAK